MSVYMNYDNVTIIKCSIKKLNGNTIQSLVTFSMVVPICAINTTTENNF